MPYTDKDKPESVANNRRPNHDRGKGPSHVPDPRPKYGPMGVKTSRYHAPLKAGWRRIGTPKQRENDVE